ncbi:MAG: hypothetical protein ACREJJ_00560 [Candidatus Methylomirabilales bacterium]
MQVRRIFLPEVEFPWFWYNMAGDLPKPPPPPLHLDTGDRVDREALAPLFLPTLTCLSKHGGAR